MKSARGLGIAIWQEHQSRLNRFFLLGGFFTPIVNILGEIVVAKKGLFHRDYLAAT